MITGNIKNQVDQIWNAFWSGELQLRGAIAEGAAVAKWAQPRNDLICNRFLDNAIATEGLLVAIPQQCRGKQGPGMGANPGCQQQGRGKYPCN